jgi:1-acyl-sn-glycerol-3-phosphate acyltransferase
MTAVRSLLFNIAFFSWTTVCCFGLLWMLLLPRRQMVHVVEWYLGTIHFLERTILGLDYEIRGAENLPREGSYVLASKHQSAWETMKLRSRSTAALADAPSPRWWRVPARFKRKAGRS